MTSSRITSVTARPARLRAALFTLVGLPLIALHAMLLFDRLARWETIDGMVTARWLGSFALLAAFGLSSRLRTHGASLLIACLLALVLIHAPATTLEPAMPIATTSLGLTFLLVFAGIASAAERVHSVVIATTAGRARTGGAAFSREHDGRGPPFPVSLPRFSVSPLLG